MSAAVILFLAAAFSLRNSGWAGNVELHAHMQIVATILAAMVGVLALVRHYSQKNNTILLLGMAFLGAAFLDGYYLVVASWTFSAYFPSTLDTLISWSWLASRFYLSLLLFLSWAVWKRGQRRGDSRLIPEKKIYLATGVLAVGVFLLFAFVPLPPAMYSGLFFTRPGELIPGALFLAAAIGYFRKESWKTDPLEFCILITALIGFVAQSFFMAFSVRPFDAMFDVAHLLKIAGYLVVLIGLMVDMFRYYRRVESSAGEIAHAKRQVEALALAAEAISRHLDLDAFLEAVSAESKKFFSPDRIGILAFNSEKEEWSWYYTWGLSRSYQEQVLKHFTSTPGKIAEERQELIFVEDALKSPLTVAIHGLLEREGIASAAILPLRREGKVQGILVFYYNSPRIFLEEKKVLCRAFAEQVSTAFQNALLLYEARREAERQVALKEVSQQLGQTLELDEIAAEVTRFSVQLLGGDCAHISLLEGAGSSQRPKSFYAHVPRGMEEIDLRLPEELQEEILASGQPLLIPNAREDKRVSHLRWAAQLGMCSYLAVLVVMDGEGAGILQCMSKEMNRFTRADTSLLQSLAGIGAFAMRNALLFEETQARIVEVNEMAEATAMLASGFGLQEVFNNISITSTRLLGMDRTLIMISREGSDFPEIGYAKGISGTHLDRLRQNYERTMLKKIIAGEEKGLIVYGDALTDPSYRLPLTAPKEEGFRALVVAPLGYEGKPVGALAFYWAEPQKFRPEQLALIRTFASQAAIAIEKARLHEEAQTRIKELESFHAASQNLTEKLDIEQLLERIVNSSISLLGADRCFISIQSTPGALPEILYSKGISDKHLKGLRERYPGSLLSKVTTGKVDFYYSNDVLAGPDEEFSKDVATEEGFRAVILCPLVYQGKRLGALGLYWDDPQRLSASQLRLSRTFSHQAAIAIENASLFQKSETRAARLDALNKMNQTVVGEVEFSDMLQNITATAGRIFDADISRIYLKNETTGELELLNSHGLVPVPFMERNVLPAESVGGWLVQTGRPVMISDVQVEPKWQTKEWAAENGIHALMAQPLRRGDKIVGMINCMSKKKGYFGIEDLGLLSTFASQAAILVENAKLHESAQARIAELESLQKAAQAVTSVQDLGSLTRQVAEATMEMLHGTRYFLAIYRQETNEIEIQFKGLSQDYIDFVRENFDGTIMGRSLESQGATKMENVYEDQGYPFSREVAEREGFRSFLVNPFIYQGKALGGLTVYWDEPRKISDAEVSLMRTFADQAAVAIQNAALHEQAQSYIAAMEKMQDAVKELTTEHHLTEVFLKIEKSTADLLGAKCFHIFTKEGGAAHLFYKSESIGERHIEFVVKNFKKAIVGKILSGHEGPVALGDTLSSPHLSSADESGREALRFGALLSCPLVYRGETFGAITFLWEKSRNFLPHEIALGQTFADQAAVAIQNAALFQRTEEHASRMATLNELNLDISENLDLHAVLDRIAVAAAELTKADASRIIQLNRSTGRYDLVATSAEEKSQVGKLSFGLGEGLGGFVGKLKKGLVIPDIHEDLRWVRTDLPWEGELHGYVGAPGIQGGEAILVINCFSRERDFFDQEDLELLEALAAQTTIAVQNASLYENLAHRAREIEVSEARFRSVVQSAQDGVVAIDQRGAIILFNEAAEKMFGHRESEIQGENIKILMPSPYKEEHDDYLDNYLRTGEQKVIGTTKVLKGIRKNGEIFPIEISVAEVNVEGAHFYTGIVRDVTERFEIDRMKNEFISMVSHEIRTPLTSLRGALGLLGGGFAGEIRKEGKELLRIAVSNADRLIRLINDILDLEKIESGTMKLEIESHSLSEIIEKALAEMQGTADNYGVELKTDLVACDVEVDSDTIVQVMTNLLSNAAKFSEPGQTVTVKSRIVGNDVEVCVTDRGRGIPPEKFDLIFERFQQADSTDSRDKGGTGLGLTICKSIIEKHEGKIWLESKLGEGSNFCFTLPLASGDIPDRAGPGLGAATG